MSHSLSNHNSGVITCYMSCDNTSPLKQDEHIYMQWGPQEVCHEFILIHGMKKKLKRLSGYSLELSKGICLQLSGSPGQGQ